MADAGLNSISVCVQAVGDPGWAAVSINKTDLVAAAKEPIKLKLGIDALSTRIILWKVDAGARAGRLVQLEDWRAVEDQLETGDRVVVENGALSFSYFSESPPGEVVGPIRSSEVSSTL